MTEKVETATGSNGNLDPSSAYYLEAKVTWDRILSGSFIDIYIYYIDRLYKASWLRL